MAVEPRVSVVIPVYNGQQYIDAIRESITNQRFQDFEVIVIDDGSTDDSGALLDNWQSSESNVSILHVENKGAAAARNLGVTKARGEYIAFVDVDDTITVDYLEYLIALAKDGADIAVGGFINIFGDTAKSIYEDEDDILELTGKEGMERLLYQKGIMSVPWGYIARKSLWDKVSFPENTRAEDMGTIYRLYYEADKVVIGKHVVYNYFQRSSNTMFSTSDKRNVDYYMHSDDMVRFVARNCKDCLGAAYSRHFSTCFQILSETKLGDKSGILSKVYMDIKNLRGKVCRDKAASLRNRIAAVLSFVSIHVLHMLLRGYYKYRLRSLNK